MNNLPAELTPTQLCLLAADERIKAIFEEEKAGDLYDLTRPLAMARALVRFYIECADLTATLGPAGSDPPILRALSALETVARLVERRVKVDGKRRAPVSRDELDQVKGAMVTVFREFVPADRFEGARLRLGQLVAARTH